MPLVPLTPEQIERGIRSYAVATWAAILRLRVLGGWMMQQLSQRD